MRYEFEMAEDHDHDLGARIAGAVTGAGLVGSVQGPSPDSRLF